MATTNHYDAIVVGARCAGSPTAMLLARKGYRVLLVDRNEFPSDTISTQMIHPPGVARLHRWGLLGRLIDTRCPAIETYRYDFGAFTITGRPAPSDGTGAGYAPRRTILDKLLVDAAAQAGAEVREAFTVEGLLMDDGRATGIRGRTRAGVAVAEPARVVIGADGRYSMLAKAVESPQYHEKPPLQCGYYTYWSDLPANAFETYIRLHRGWAAIPTHDDLTLVVLGWPHAEFEANKKDVEGAYLKTLELAPAFAERVRRARREAPFRGGPVSSFFRKPFGPGWALVGDAGYNKDPVTAWGISDAFRDAEGCAEAIDAWLGSGRPFDEAMAGYQERRDEESLPMFELTCTFAALEPPPPDMQQLLHAVSASQPAQDRFVSMMAGTFPVPAFFAHDNVARIFASGAQRAAG